MRIYIPTYGRVDNQKTLARIPTDACKVFFVARPEEVKDLKRIYKDDIEGVLSVSAVGVPAARQAAMMHALKEKENRVVFLDDDLSFSHRGPKWSLDNPRLERTNRGMMRYALSWMEGKLATFAAAGLGARAMNHTIDKDELSPARMMRAFGVRVDILKKHKIRFDTFKYWEDFHVTLSLLTLGYPNVISARYLCDAQTNSDGGCSTYRNLKELAKVQTAFVDRYAPYASAVTKKASSWGGELNDAEVPEVRMAWQKALAAGVKQFGKRKVTV